MERASLEQKLAAAAQSEEALWTPECLEPDALIALIEQGASAPTTVAQMAHVVSCAYCRREFDEMEATLQIAAKARELQSPPPSLAAANPVAEEANPQRHTDAVPFWRRYFAPSLSFAFGAAAAVLLLYLLRVRPLTEQTDRLQAQIARQEQEAGERVAQAQKDLEARIAAARGDTERLQKENTALQQRAAQSQIYIAALERQVKQAMLRSDESGLALEALREAATASEQALAVLNETQRNTEGVEPSPVRLLSPVASVLLDRRVTFQWEAKEGATEYVVLVQDAAARQVAKSAPLQATEWTAALPASQGKESLNYYEWWVIAQRGAQEIGKSSATRFAALDTKKLVEGVKAKRSLKP